MFATSSVRAPLALLALLATGCSVSTPLVTAPRALFAEAGDGARYKALLVAVGRGLAHAEHAERSADLDSQPNGDGTACPSVEILVGSESGVRYAADEPCTSATGVTYSGTLDAGLELDDGELGAVFDEFHVDDGETAVTLDGSWSRTDAADGAYTVTAHLRTVEAGRVAQVHGSWSVRDQGDHDRVLCDAGLQGAIEGLGGFEVRCELRGFGDGGVPGEGWVELTADDTMRVDLTPDADGCLAVTIDRIVQAPLCPRSAPHAGLGPLDTWEW